MYHVAGSEGVIVERDLPFHVGEHGSLVMDVYRPPDAASSVAQPAVIIVAGFSADRSQVRWACAFKDVEWSVCWGRLIAASGMTAIFYTNCELVANSLRALLAHVRGNAVGARRRSGSSRPVRDVWKTRPWRWRR